MPIVLESSQSKKLQSLQKEFQDKLAKAIKAGDHQPQYLTPVKKMLRQKAKEVKQFIDQPCLLSGISASGSWNLNALCWAVWMGSAGVVATLLEDNLDCCADINCVVVKDPEPKEVDPSTLPATALTTPLLTATDAYHNELVANGAPEKIKKQLTLIDFLISKGAHPNGRPADAEYIAPTLLQLVLFPPPNLEQHRIALYELAKYFLSKGASLDVHFRTDTVSIRSNLKFNPFFKKIFDSYHPGKSIRFDYTPLHAAVLTKNLQMIQLFLSFSEEVQLTKLAGVDLIEVMEAENSQLKAMMREKEALKELMALKKRITVQEQKKFKEYSDVLHELDGSLLQLNEAIIKTLAGRLAYERVQDEKDDRVLSVVLPAPKPGKICSSYHEVISIIGRQNLINPKDLRRQAHVAPRYFKDLLELFSNIETSEMIYQLIPTSDDPAIRPYVMFLLPDETSSKRENVTFNNLTMENGTESFWSMEYAFQMTGEINNFSRKLFEAIYKTDSDAWKAAYQRYYLRQYVRFLHVHSDLSNLGRSVPTEHNVFDLKHGIEKIRTDFQALLSKRFLDKAVENALAHYIRFSSKDGTEEAFLSDTLSFFTKKCEEEVLEQRKRSRYLAVSRFMDSIQYGVENPSSKVIHRHDLEALNEFFHCFLAEVQMGWDAEQGFDPDEKTMDCLTQIDESSFALFRKDVRGLSSLFSGSLLVQQIITKQVGSSCKILFSKGTENAGDKQKRTPQVIFVFDPAFERKLREISKAYAEMAGRIFVDDQGRHCFEWTSRGKPGPRAPKPVPVTTQRTPLYDAKRTDSEGAFFRKEKRSDRLDLTAQTEPSEVVEPMQIEFRSREKGGGDTRYVFSDEKTVTNESAADTEEKGDVQIEPLFEIEPFFEKRTFVGISPALRRELGPEQTAELIAGLKQARVASGGIKRTTRLERQLFYGEKAFAKYRDFKNNLRFPMRMVEDKHFDMKSGQDTVVFWIDGMAKHDEEATRCSVGLVVSKKPKTKKTMTQFR